MSLLQKKILVVVKATQKKTHKSLKFPSRFKLSMIVIFILTTVVNQFYDAEITKEYVMRGNSAILKCLIPSFVADFVHVVAWINEDLEEIVPEKDFNSGNNEHSEVSP